MKLSRKDFISDELLKKIEKRERWLTQEGYPQEEKKEESFFNPNQLELQSIGIETVRSYGLELFSFPITGSNRRHYELWLQGHQEGGNYRKPDTKPKDIAFYERIDKLDSTKRWIYMYSHEKGKKEILLDYPKKVVLK